jgi:hypothetical protein
MKYDPEEAPDSVAWLALDEDLRIGLIESHHREQGIVMPSVTAHAAFHSVVENQLAEGLDPVVQVMGRLKKEGLSRHESVHAVASILAEFLYESMKTGGSYSGYSQERYADALARLTAASWRRNNRLP